ncbi:putative quinol monooxygenase [Rathayibacter sp. Leaf248]|uniref:putative quinol monooxygenase n=1 Tax=Rathayibacter sp. Leaf248 TaxID=2876555 RepID=UPI001E5CF5B3|nr:putative quinol monooxygenase [Rathayibacter sp. Leaf248]
MTAPVVVHVVFTPAEGARERMIDALRAGIAEVHGEPGCELYSIHDAPDGTVVMIEKWTSAAELDAHGAGEPVARLNASLEGLLQEPPRIVRLAPIPAGTPEQGAL